MAVTQDQIPSGVRFYVVWVNPAHEENIGIIAVRGVNPYQRLTARFPGGQHQVTVSGVRWKRALELDSAFEIYRAEARKHHCPPEPPLWLL